MITLGFGQSIVWASGLAFLGLGVAPPSPEWGALLDAGRDYVVSAWWLKIMPGLAIIIFACAVTNIGHYLAFVRSDRLVFDGHDLTGLPDRDWGRLRGKHIGFVLQDALVSLDQLRPVGREVGEGLRLHGGAGTKAELTERVVELLQRVGVQDPAAKTRHLPHELSGGQRQRALIAAALALDPWLLIADEPMTALDVTVQAQILALLEETRARGKALILISHNLASSPAWPTR